MKRLVSISFSAMFVAVTWACTQIYPEHTPSPIQTTTTQGDKDNRTTDVSIHLTKAPSGKLVATHLEGLWVGDVTESTMEAHPLWLAFRLIPGTNPVTNRWRIETGPYPSILPPAMSCSATSTDSGWYLDKCIGLRGRRFKAFVPEESQVGVEVSYSHRRLTFTSTMSLIKQRDELQSSTNITLLWHQPGNGIHSDIWADSGLVFAPRVSDGKIEILDAESGVILGTAIVPRAHGRQRNSVWDVKASQNFLYAATASQGLVIFDVSEPSEPKLVGQHHISIENDQDSPENFVDIHNIFLSPDGKWVLAINTSSAPYSDLRIIDVSDPTSPHEVGRFAKENIGPLESVHDINVIERDGKLFAFLNYVRAGLWILDITNPSDIIPLGSIKWDGIFSHSGWAFQQHDRLYYAHLEEGHDKHMTLLDVTNPERPKIVSRFRTRRGISIHNVQVVHGIAYISYYIDGLRVVDLRDPKAPREIGHFDTVPATEERDIFQGVWGVRVVNDIVYLSDLETGTYALTVVTD